MHGAQSALRAIVVAVRQWSSNSPEAAVPRHVRRDQRRIVDQLGRRIASEDVFDESHLDVMPTATGKAQVRTGDGQHIAHCLHGASSHSIFERLGDPRCKRQPAIADCPLAEHLAQIET